MRVLPGKRSLEHANALLLLVSQAEISCRYTRIEDTGDSYLFLLFQDENTGSQNLFLYNKNGGFETLSQNFMVGASENVSYT